MTDSDDFLERIRRAQAGDQTAADEIFRRFERHVRRIAKIKLSNSAIRQRVDEDDVCQSVFGVFFDGLKDGRFVVATDDDARRLLADVTRKRVLKAIERHTADKRNVAQQADLGEAAFDPMSEESTASVKVSRVELVDGFLSSLSERDREILARRRDGRTWEEIAGEFKMSADAVRVRVGRIAKDARERLGIGVD